MENNTRRTGYAFHGKKTLTLKKQVAELKKLGCDPIFIDESPSRTARGDMLFAVLPGDTVVIANPSVIGSGAKDTQDIVRAISAKGVPIEVVGCGAKLYDAEGDIRGFATVALKVSRRTNLKAVHASPVKVGRKAKAGALSDDQWAVVKWLWNDGRAKQAAIVDLCSKHWGVEVSRSNINNRLKTEAEKEN